MHPRELTSTSNPRLKQAHRLHRRRHREKEGLLLVEGPRVVATALDLGVAAVDVFLTEALRSRAPELADRLDASPARQWTVSEAMMDALAATEHSQGIVMTARMPQPAETLDVGPGFLAIALDGIGDPGNLGAIVRAAHAMGADAAILGPGCCDRFNPKTVRASAGGVFAVPLVVTDDLASSLRALRSRGARVAAATASPGRPFWTVDLTGPAVVVIGSEAHGLSPDVLAAADDAIGIPMPGGAESLNAATAAAVLLCEAIRQRSACHTEGA
ncbi:RNA methyltransferase [bacterium]|nr:RNA methyltransferase [bacterium]